MTDILDPTFRFLYFSEKPKTNKMGLIVVKTNKKTHLSDRGLKNIKFSSIRLEIFIENRKIRNSGKNLPGKI